MYLTSYFDLDGSLGVQRMLRARVHFEEVGLSERAGSMNEDCVVVVQVKYIPWDRP